MLDAQNALLFRTMYVDEALNRIKPIEKGEKKMALETYLSWISKSDLGQTSFPISPVADV